MCRARGPWPTFPATLKEVHARLVWVDRQGAEEELPLKRASYLFPRLSPDGKKLVVEVEGRHPQPVHLGLLPHGPDQDDDRRAEPRAAVDAGRQEHLLPLLEGRHDDDVGDAVGRQPPGGAPHGFRCAAERGVCVARWTLPGLQPDGGHERRRRQGGHAEGDGMADMAGGMGAMGTGCDIWILPLQGSDRTPQRFKGDKFDEASPKFSPDGKLVAYCSNRVRQERGVRRTMARLRPRLGDTDLVGGRHGSALEPPRPGDLLSQRRQDDGGAGQDRRRGNSRRGCPACCGKAATPTA